LSNLQAAGCPNESVDFGATLGLFYNAFLQDIYALKMQKETVFSNRFTLCRDIVCLSSSKLNCSALSLFKRLYNTQLAGKPLSRCVVLFCLLLMMMT
jgi:hypothetical protein